MVHLQKMDADEFSRYLPRLIEGYAQEMSENMDLALDAARERSTRQIHELLPQGTDTPNHLIYVVQVEGSPETAGYLWVFMDPAKKTTLFTILKSWKPCAARAWAGPRCKRLRLSCMIWEL